MSDQDSPSTDRAPTADERAGMAWFNALSRPTRAYWLEQARIERGRDCPYDASAAEAWHVYKRRRADDPSRDYDYDPSCSCGYCTRTRALDEAARERRLEAAARRLSDAIVAKAVQS